MAIPKVQISPLLSEILTDLLRSEGDDELLMHFTSGSVSVEELSQLEAIINGRGAHFWSSAGPVVMRDFNKLALDMAKATYNGNRLATFSFHHANDVQTLVRMAGKHLENYPYHQRCYFLRLYGTYLDGLGSLECSFGFNGQVANFTKMNPQERSEFVIDIGDLQDDPELIERAKEISVMMLELNGGLGSRMGLDPAHHHSKGTGISMFVDVESSYGPQVARMSIMEAKLRALSGLTKVFKKVHVMPFNSTVTSDGWNGLMNGPSLEARAGKGSESNRIYLEKAGLHIHDEIPQTSFPKIGDTTYMPIEIGQPDIDLAPGGDGQVLHELYYSGRLKKLWEQHGIQVLVIGDAENIQARPHPAIAAKLLEDKIPIAFVSTDRTAADANAAIFVVEDGSLEVIETSRVHKSQQRLFQDIGLRKGDKPQPMNTNTAYINVPECLKIFERETANRGDEELHKLLVPETVANKREVVLGGQRIPVRHLEGSMASVLHNFVGARIFNASAQDRWTQFAPIKKPVDFIYFYNSDVFELDAKSGETKPLKDKISPPAITLRGWNGWKSLAETMKALGRPSMKDLQSLYIEGEVFLQNAILRGDVAIKSDYNGRIDLNESSFARWLSNTSGQLFLENVKVDIDRNGGLTMKWLHEPAPSISTTYSNAGGASSLHMAIYSHDTADAAFMGGFMGAGNNTMFHPAFAGTAVMPLLMI
ncbi:MAG: UTP--glucose-1-phosphate uridylyltransferase [Pseudomonadota bacterium]